ncbi:hypothetical protein M8J76_015976 [Diaphorina citri]|nr:hypothetical protein M8J76_015976 [Diaphorina citri]
MNKINTTRVKLFQALFLLPRRVVLSKPLLNKQCNGKQYFHLLSSHNGSLSNPRHCDGRSFVTAACLRKKAEDGKDGKPTQNTLEDGKVTQNTRRGKEIRDHEEDIKGTQNTRDSGKERRTTTNGANSIKGTLDNIKGTLNRTDSAEETLIEGNTANGTKHTKGTQSGPENAEKTTNHTTLESDVKDVKEGIDNTIARKDIKESIPERQNPKGTQGLETSNPQEPATKTEHKAKTQLSNNPQGSSKEIRQKNVFASAHEEFNEILRRNANEALGKNGEVYMEGPSTSGVYGRKHLVDGGGESLVGEDGGGDNGNVNANKEAPNAVNNNDKGTKVSGRRKIEAGMQFETEIQFSYDDIISFGKLSRDWNPIHYYRNDGRVKHLSRIFRIRSVEEIEAKANQNAVESSSQTPSQSEPTDQSDSSDEENSPDCIILHQTLDYKNFGFVNEKIRVRVRVTQVRKMLVTATYKAWTIRPNNSNKDDIESNRSDKVVILKGDAKLVYRS